MASISEPLAISLHAELSSLGMEGSPTSWTVKIILDGNEYDSVALKDPLTADEKAECSWYLEQYAQQSPFSVTRAGKAAALIASYSRNIISQLGLGNMVKSRLEKNEKKLVVIEVSETSTSPDGTIHQMLWESLEDGTAWDLGEGANVRICVRRLLESPAGPVDNPTAPIRIKTATSDGETQTINVLMVVARDLSDNSGSYEDISPFISSGILTTLKHQLKDSKGPVQLSLEIVRPGTFSALQEHLAKTKNDFGAGYYKVIHFDMHGAIKTKKATKAKSGFLYFDHPRENRKVAVDAVKVGALLQEHQIEIAVLNACQSARANAGDDANIAKVFYRHGVRNVLAMSFKVSSHASEMFLGAFYYSVLAEGQPFSQAAATAREILRQSPTRHARFGLNIAVLDWLIPVTYASGSGSEVTFSGYSRGIENSAFKAWASTPMQDVLGRDFDLLRLEKALIQHTRILYYGSAGVGKTALLKLGCSIWRETGFMDSVVYLDFGTGMLGSQNAVMKAVLEQLKYTIDTTLTDTEALRRELREVLRDRKVLLVLDNLHGAFSPVQIPLYGCKLDEVEARNIQALIPELFGPKNHVIIAVRTYNPGTKDQDAVFPAWSDAHPLQLERLDLASGMELLQHMLRQTELYTEPLNHADLDTIELTVSLLDCLPAAIRQAILDAKANSIPLDQLFDFIHRFKLMSSFQEAEERLMTGRIPDCPHLMEVASLVFFLRDEAAVPLIKLTRLWLKGPLIGTLWDDESTADHIGDTQDLGPGLLAIRIARDLGLLSVNGDSNVITWISPLLTLAEPRIRLLLHKIAATAESLRSIETPSAEDQQALDFTNSKLLSIQAAQYGPTLTFAEQTKRSEDSAPESLTCESLTSRDRTSKEEILHPDFLEWLGKAVGTPYWDQIATVTQGMEVGDMRPIYAPYLFNMLTLINTALSPTSIGTAETWLWRLLSGYTDHFVIIASPGESKLAARYYQRLVTEYFSASSANALGDDKYAISPEIQGPVLHTIQFIIRMRLQYGHNPGDGDLSHKELQIITETILIQSERKYGPFTAYEPLYEKGYILRMRILMTMRDGERRKEILEKLMTEFLAVDKATSQALADLNTGPSSSDITGIYNLLQTYHSTRSQTFYNLIRLVQNSAESSPAEMAALNEALTELSGTFKEIKTASEQALVTGTDKDPQSMPPNADMTSYFRRYEQHPLARLQDLEISTGTGKWTEAMDHHDQLLLKALEDLDMEEVLLHIDCLLQMCKDDPAFAEKVEDLSRKQEYFLAFGRFQDTLDTFFTRSHGDSVALMSGAALEMSAVAEAGAITSKTTNTTGSASLDSDENADLALGTETADLLSLSIKMWETESSLAAGYNRSDRAYFKKVVSAAPETQKTVIKLIYKHAGDKSYLSRFTETLTRIMTLYLEIQQCELTNRADDALKLLAEVEELSRSEFGPYLLDIDRLPHDRACLEWKRDWCASVLRWRDAAAVGDWVAAQDEIKLGERLREMEIARDTLDITGENDEKEVHRETAMDHDKSFLIRKAFTQQNLWTFFVAKARDMFVEEDYDAVLTDAKDLLRKYEGGDFDLAFDAYGEEPVGTETRRRQSKIDEEKKQLGIIKTLRALALWNRDYGKCKDLLMEGDFSAAADALSTLLGSFGSETDNYKDAGGAAGMHQGLKAAKLAMAMSWARRDLVLGEWLRCIRTCDEFLAGFSSSSSSATLAPAHDETAHWAIVTREDAKIAYHNNEYLRADFEFRYDDAVRHIEKLGEVMRQREQMPEVDRSESIVVGMPREMLDVMRAQVHQKKATLEMMGPVMGRKFILAARAMMGYQPQFR